MRPTCIHEVLTSNSSKTSEVRRGHALLKRNFLDNPDADHSLLLWLHPQTAWSETYYFSVFLCILPAHIQCRLVQDTQKINEAVFDGTRTSRTMAPSTSAALCLSKSEITSTLTQHSLWHPCTRTWTPPAAHTLYMYNVIQHCT